MQHMKMKMAWEKILFMFLMEIFGVKRVGVFSIRKIITRVITVQMAAKIHRVPLDKFLDILNKAVRSKN